MAETSTEEHVFRLSSLDQAGTHEYIRCCLCFPCSLGIEDTEHVIEKFTANIKRAVIHLPIIAGRLRPATTQDDKSQRLEAVLKIDDVSSFRPIFNNLPDGDLSYDLKAWEEGNLPPSALISELATLDDATCADSIPAFAVHVGFLTGAVLVVLSLHNSIGDAVSLGVVARHLSSNFGDPPNCTITNDSLKYEAVEQSRLRDRLSGSRGIKAEIARSAFSNLEANSSDSAHSKSDSETSEVACRILTFGLSFLAELRDLVNQRFQYIHSVPAIQLSCFDALAAVLWKGISRALLFRRDLDLERVRTESTSCLVMPQNIRKTVEPGLEDSFFGNATIPVTVSSPLVNVSMPFEAGTLARTARSIHDAVRGVSEKLVRSIIASINERSDTKVSMSVNTATDVLIASWADLGLENADLGLGLGPPKYVRKIGRSLTANVCTIHPPREAECEVTVQLPEDVMEALLGDEGFMAFVARVV